MRNLFLGVGGYLLVTGAWMIVSPGSFFDVVGPFEERNDHYIRDVATFQVALGVMAVLAANRRAWRAPVLAGLALQFVLHTVNHVVDVADADPKWVGIADLVVLALTAALLVRAWGMYERRRRST